MKDGKQAIRYIGFESRAKGDRQLQFSVDEPGRQTLLITFEIAATFFAGKDRILVQEAAGICYTKLKDILNAECESGMESGIVVTATDIVQYRHLRASRSPKSGA